LEKEQLIKLGLILDERKWDDKIKYELRHLEGSFCGNCEKETLSLLQPTDYNLTYYNIFPIFAVCANCGRISTTFDFMAYDSKGEIGYLPIKNYEK
jgi:hypothetical protein